MTSNRHVADSTHSGIPMVPSRVKNVPKIVDDDNAYRLTDLINAEFRLPANDKDFGLSHEQLIKCCKILLYKLNLASKRSQYQRTELTQMINERIENIEKVTKSSLEEVNTFLHTVHQDFESFLNKHRKEHTGLNMRVLKVSEDVSEMVKQYASTKSAVE